MSFSSDDFCGYKFFLYVPKMQNNSTVINDPYDTAGKYLAPCCNPHISHITLDKGSVSLRSEQHPTHYSQMTLLSLSHTQLKTTNPSLERVASIANCAIVPNTPASIEVAGPIDDCMLQSINKKRRYQRRGSRVPSMIMVGSSLTHLDGTDLLEIQRRLLADREFLRSLLAADMLEDERLKRASGQSSIESQQVTNSPIVQEIMKRKRATAMERNAISSKSE